MPKYKNVSEKTAIFRAGKSAEKPWEKKVYTVEPQKTVDIPVPITNGQMEQIDEGEMTIRKSKKGVEV